MLDDFLIRAALAGLGVALAAAPLGCFVVWRRMAYFGDATAHAAILGVALALAIWHIGLCRGAGGGFADGGWWSPPSADAAMRWTLCWACWRIRRWPSGWWRCRSCSGVRIDLMAYLFGDILAVSAGDLAVIWGGAALVLAVAGVALAGAADRHAEPRSGLCQRHRSPARTAGADTCAGPGGGRGDQGGRRAADRRPADHPCRRRPSPGAHTRADGADGRNHRGNVGGGRALGLADAGHAHRAQHCLRRGDLFCGDEPWPRGCSPRVIRATKCSLDYFSQKFQKYPIKLIGLRIPR